jgi:predicted solute-binding protein
LERLNQSLIASRNRFFADPVIIDEGVRIARTRCTISPEKLLSYFTRSLTYGLSDSHRITLDKFDNILNHLDRLDRDPQQIADPALR